MKKDESANIRRGTKNVFADLGFPDAETHLLKAELVTRIQGVISKQKLTQTAAANLMGLGQPDVSRLLNGQFRDVSVERLMRLLTRLGCDVDITIRGHGKAVSARDTIRLRQDIRTGAESGHSEAWNPEAIKQQSHVRRTGSKALAKT